ncbi:MAG: efflux RND transporter permease subunit [Planctomycetota bacterium]
MIITNYSIKHYMAVIVLCVAIVITGIYSYLTLPRESFPDVQLPYIIVSTGLRGATPTDIETSITILLEQELDSVEGRKTIRSSSMEGFSIISVEFESGVENQVALQRVRDKIDIAKGDLPQDADEPIIKEFSLNAEFPMLTYALTGSEKIALSELYDLADKIEDEIKVIPGVLEVDIIGGRDREVLVEVDPSRAQLYGLSIAQVKGILMASNVNTSVGSTDSAMVRLTMRAPGEFRTPGEIFNLPVGNINGVPVYIRDVANVYYSFVDEQTRARFYDFSVKGSNNTINAIVRNLKAKAKDENWSNDQYANAVKQKIANRTDGDDSPYKLDDKEYSSRILRSINGELENKATDEEAILSNYVNPKKTIALHVKRKTGSNIVEIAEQADKIIGDLYFPEDVSIVKTMDQSKFVKTMVDDLENGVLTSLILVLIVVFIGMGFRNALLVSLAIPFSMLSAFLIIKLVGLTLNMIVLFSLILALGMLVDNAIVIVENIHRHHSMGVSRTRASIIGVQEVAWPVIASTLTTVGAFFPLVFWPGIMGEFMGYLPRTVIIVLMCSLLVALTINPTLAALFISRSKVESAIDPETQRPTYRLAMIYQRGLEFMLDRSAWTLSCATIVFFMSLLLLMRFGKGVQFFPETDPQETTVSIKPPEGSSVERSDVLSRAAEDRLLGAPGSGYEQYGMIRNLKQVSVSVGLSGGGGNFGGDVGPVQVKVTFADSAYRTESTKETVIKMRNRVAGLSDDGKTVVALPLIGADYDVILPQEGPPTGKALSIDIFGEDLNEMTRVAWDMKDIIANTPGAAKPMDDAETSQPTIEWRIDRPTAGLYGLEQGTIGSILELAVGGTRSGTVGHGDDEQDIIFRYPIEYRDDTNRLNYIGAPTPTGHWVPMISFASADLVPGPVAIKHLDLKRVVNASADVQPGIINDAGIRKSFQTDAKRYAFPSGITYSFGGAAEEEEAAKIFLTEAFVIALVIVMLVLVLQFNSVLVPGIIMVTILLSLIGIFFGLVAFQMPFGIIMTGVGVISLAGVVVNNAIVLLDAVRQFQKRGLSVREAVVSAGMVRLRPVLLTATTTTLGLVPMAFKFNIDFKNLTYQYNTDTAQFWQGMASAVIFGMFVSTVLTLGVVPTLYYTYWRFKTVFDRLHLFSLDEKVEI